jgi:hypothetical protein
MENQQHLMNTIGPMYVTEQQQKAAAPAVNATTIDTAPAAPAKKAAKKKTA